MFRWDDHPKVEKKLADLYDKYGNNYSAINEVLNEEYGEVKEFTLDSTRNRIRRSPIIDYIPNKRGKGIFADLYDEDLDSVYKEEKEHIKQVMKQFEKDYGNKEVKVLVINDLHIPKANINVLEAIIHQHQDADILVIAGDYLDYDSISFYGQSKNIDVSDEYKMGYKIMNKLASIFEKVYIINGNHEYRLTRYFKNKIVTGFNGFLMEKHKPLTEIVRYFDNVEYVNHWFMQLGDFVFAHPSRYSKVTMRSVENVIKHLIKRRHEKEFANFEAVGIGHTHRLGNAEAFGRYGYEFGCIEDKDVEFRNKDAKGNKWEYGYGIVNFKNGKYDYNLSREYKVENY
jgi:predicted phosphodiesterase